MEDYGIAIGTANYSGSKKRTFKLEKQKENAYRPLPPLGEAAKKGLWMVPYAVHWGDKGSDGKMKPYQCIQKMEKLADGSKRVTRRCPRCEKNATVKEKRDARAAEWKTKGMGDAQITEKLRPIDEYLRQYNRGFRFYMNALNTKGEIGRLDISGTHADQLREQIADLLKNGVDVTAPNQGVYMNFYYEGLKGHTVKPVMEAVSGGGVGAMQLKMAPLTPAVLRNLKDEYWDLLDLYPVLTEAQIQSLVDNEGSPEVVDNIFSAGKVSASSPTVANSTPPAMFEDTKFDDGLDDLVKPKAAVAANTAVQQAAPAPAPAAAIENLSDDDFEKSFGI
jgi:predicted  nucleic acid-binding Zn-ribbon protein